MKTTSIHIEGQIISPEIFDRLETNDIPGQLPQDFGFERGLRVKYEITRAWADAKDQWNIFKRRTERLSENESGTTETRKYWVLPLLESLGYNLSLEKAEEVNGNSFALSHRDNKLEGFPVHIVGVNDSLDKRRETGGPRLSPHALVQEYLNITEHLYGIVTNGYQLRLLRDSGKLIRLTYMEFDLFQMLEDDLFAEFSLMNRLLHASRMPQKFGEGDSSIIEQYHQLSLEAGARIRDKLSNAVEISIKQAANGFLKHPLNNELRENIRTKRLLEEEFFRYLLRFIYRILFLMVLEERDLIYPNHRDEKQNYYHDVYYNYYSISRIRKLADNIFFFDEKLEDLWISLRNTFKIFGSERLAAKLGIYPLNGELFDYSSLGILSDSNLDNHTLLQCIRNLSVFDNSDTKSIIRVNYAALNVEEFGSVYEGLLEKAPRILDDDNVLRFDFEKGTERSSSGSHYTPEELVQPLIKHSLDYVIEDKLKKAEEDYKKNLKRTKDAVIQSTSEESKERDSSVVSLPQNDNNKTASHSDPDLSGEESLSQFKEKALLSIKVCDVACGSGHILLSAARRIAQNLTTVRTGEEQPAPEPFREAIRDVINHCIYGVDKNPLAVELCKVALWLEAHNPGMPLNFLDHRIKCGDSIVGLARIDELYNGIATEAFKRMPNDDKEIASSFTKKNREDIKNRTQLKLTDTQEVIDRLNSISVKFKDFNELPDNTVEAVKKKTKEYNVLKGDDWWKLKEAVDVQVAQFFIPKTNANKEFLTTDADYFRILAGEKARNERRIAKAMAIGAEKKVFHWFLEFPEVFAEGKNPEQSEGSDGGFDCILGNPPYLGGKKISGTYGLNFLEILHFSYPKVEGQSDLVTYFLRRTFQLIKNIGCLALITTNSICEGDTRKGGLEYLINNEGIINYAIRSIKWPGVANLNVSLISVFKKIFSNKIFFNSKRVIHISSYLDDAKDITPKKLNQNLEQMFRGVDFAGEGFILDIQQAKTLLENDQSSSEIIFPLLNGEILNNNPEQKTDRFIINFFDWPLRRASIDEWGILNEKEKKELIRKGIQSPDYSSPVAKDFPTCLTIIEVRVKPERTRWKKDKNGNEIVGTYAMRMPLPIRWWIYGEKRPGLQLKLKRIKRCIVNSFTAKHLNFLISKPDYIFTNALNVLTLESFSILAILQSNLHENWARKFASSLETRLRYTPTDVFETFPFPQSHSQVNEIELEKIGEEYHEFRRKLMLDIQLGLTKTYNLFHNPECNSNNIEKAKEIREFKNANLQIPIEEAIQRIEKLRELHKQMDEIVLKAYGWGPDSSVVSLPQNDNKKEGVILNASEESLPPIDLKHNFYEVDYLPENDRIRYTISPEARKEILKRLLELNHKIHEEEVKAGLWEKKGKGKKKKANVDEGQGGLFGE